MSSLPSRLKSATAAATPRPTLRAVSNVPSPLPGKEPHDVSAFGGESLPGRHTSALLVPLGGGGGGGDEPAEVVEVGPALVRVRGVVGDGALLERQRRQLIVVDPTAGIVGGIGRYGAVAHRQRSGVV